MSVKYNSKTVLKYCDCEWPRKYFMSEKKKEELFLIALCIFVALCIGVICYFVVFTLYCLNDLDNDIKKIKVSVTIMKDTATKVHDNENLLHYRNPYYDFSDEEEDEEDDYGGDGEYLDYDPEKSQIVVDNEYESASNLTKDGRDGNGKQIVKRSIVATTKDGLLVNSESYSNSKAKNSTHRRRPLHKHHHEGKSVTEMPGKLSAFGYPWSYRQTVYQNTNSKLSAERIAANLPQNGGTNSPVNVPKKPSISVRRSRVMRGEDPPKSPRKIVKKPFLKAGDLEYDSYYHSGEISTTAESTMVPEAAIGRHRKLGRSRPLISIHFSGDTSKYVLGKHDNFNGNGHLRHLQRNFIDWTPSDWVKKTGMESHFVMNEGIVTIKESGLYFVYAQIYYLDEHDTTGYRVYKNHDMFLQCTITQHSSIGLVKGNTCYTAGVEFLTTGDTVYLADITQGKYSLFEPGKSFFGLIKLGDFKNK